MFGKTIAVATVAVNPATAADVGHRSSPTTAAPPAITSNAHPANRPHVAARVSNPTEAQPAPPAAKSERAQAWGKIVDGLSADMIKDHASRPSNAISDVLARNAAIQHATTKPGSVNNHITKETSIGQLNVNAPQATDAHGIAKEMGAAIQKSSPTTNQADGGMA